MPKHGHIYLMRSNFEGKVYYKIGLTTGLKVRLGTIKNASPFGVELVDSFSSENIRGDEKYLHGLFKGKRRNGEWFELDSDEVKTFARYGDFVASGRTAITGPGIGVREVC